MIKESREDNIVHNYMTVGIEFFKVYDGFLLEENELPSIALEKSFASAEKAYVQLGHQPLEDFQFSIIVKNKNLASAYLKKPLQEDAKLIAPHIQNYLKSYRKS